MKRLLRRIKALVLGILIFKDWPKWIGWRIGILPIKREEGLFRIRDGTRFFFRPDVCSGAGLFQEIYLQNQYFKSYRLKDGDVVIDIGAHIGIFSVYAARQARDVRIFSYEPSPALFNLLEKNIECNKLNNSIKPFCLAVKAGGGFHEFYSRDGIQGTTTLETALNCDPGFHKKEHFVIKATTLKNIFADNKLNRCDFLKMDCEGAEFEIILNAATDALNKISHMTIEYHFDPAPLIEFLGINGFRVWTGPILSNNLGMLYADRD